MKKGIFLVLSLSLVLSGCVTSHILHNIRNDYVFEQPALKSLVFGKFAFALPLGGECHVQFNNLETGKYHEINVKDGPLYIFRKKKEWTGYVEKTFFVELPPGNYRIKRIIISGWDRYSSNVHPMIEFTVKPNSIVYIGSMYYSFEKEKDYYFVRTGTGYYSIINQLDEATEELNNVYKNLKGAIAVDLMQLPENMYSSS